MFPLRDENHSERAPWVTRALIAINLAVFFYEISLGPGLPAFMQTWGLVPAHLSRALHGDAPLAGALAPLFTSVFLHGGWLHVIGNMWYLWIFGDNVEDRLGHAGFITFYLAAGLASGVLHTLVNGGSTVPTVGASGAIAGVLGAYLVIFPRARVITLVPVFVFIQIMSLPAVLVLGLWIVLQFFSGALSLAYDTAAHGGGTAWWGHIGGFLFGLMVGLLFRGSPPRDLRRFSEPA